MTSDALPVFMAADAIKWTPQLGLRWSQFPRLGMNFSRTCFPPPSGAHGSQRPPRLNGNGREACSCELGPQKEDACRGTTTTPKTARMGNTMETPQQALDRHEHWGNRNGHSSDWASARAESLLNRNHRAGQGSGPNTSMRLAISEYDSARRRAYQGLRRQPIDVPIDVLID